MTTVSEADGTTLEADVALRQKLQRAFEARHAEGWVACEGQWLRSDEFALLVKKSRRSARFRTFELILLLGLVLAFSAFLLILLWTLAY